MHHFDNYGWYTSEQLPGRATDIAPDNTSETTTPGELRANFTGYVWQDLPYQAPLPVLPPPPEVPQSVTRAQAKLALLQAGLLSSIQPAIDSIPDETTRVAAQIEWDDRLSFERSSGALVSMATMLGMTDAQIDELFIAASQL